ncbi:hypothetical protein BDN71DRAFT_1002134 [Pleurotus eryngii]|uniref:Uncharacterized protein n=1 Tax=Pleurotus eryngii TaxID=5323 RepID=A0A9P5ZVJ1_PLEER|nr:hypothetical protein BDN71DRAFT_1002134 [Pleurotus eryngii]
MSIDSLCSTRRTRGLSDNLESFFWVILYYSLLYVPHNKVKELNTIIPCIFEQHTHSSVPSGGDRKGAMVASGEYVASETCLEFTHSKPLSTFVASMLATLMVSKAVVMMASAASAAFDPFTSLSALEHTHKDLESIWFNLADK